MNITIQVTLHNFLLKKILQRGALFSDDIEKIIPLRLKDVFRRYRVLYNGTSSNVIRSHGTLFSLYQVNVRFDNVECTKDKLKNIISSSLSPYIEYVKKANLVIH